MSGMEKRLSILSTLIIYTVLFIFAQIALTLLYYKVNGLFNIASNAIAPYILFSRVVAFPALYFLLAEIILYVLYVYLLWYVITVASNLFSLSSQAKHVLTWLTWLMSVITILCLNMYYVPHSIFTSMIRHDLLNDVLTDRQLNILLIVSVIYILAICFFAFIQLCTDMMRGKHRIHHMIMLVIVFVLLFSFRIFSFPEKYKKTQGATAKTPNIIFIGFDALRPDHLSYFDHAQPATPHFDSFLQSSVVFSQAYTPLARTLPSWGGILTAQYPIHSHIRENNVYVPTHDLLETFPKQLKQAGYETIYATDDRRFNNIDARYGFDQVVGPQGSIADFLIGTLSDFPLSNLVVPTLLGKWLFPYNYANHGANHTYDVNNFLTAINDAIQHTSNKPLFLAVHFDLSAWPFTWFNDNQAYNVSLLHAYGHSILGDDQLLGKFLDLLKENQLLDHAIVVLLSDHGISLALPKDRAISEANFQGNKVNMKVLRTKYVKQQDRLLNLQEVLAALIKGSDEIRQQIDTSASYLTLKDYGIDTSFGYGGDLLTFKQLHPLLAMKAYGVDFGSPHEVTARVLLLDIAPTLLDLLRLPALPHADGVSLKPYLFSSLVQQEERTLYFESGFSFNAIEQEDIILSKVLSKSIAYYMVSPKTGWIMLNPSYLAVLIQSKQRGILQGDWMLVHYPASERFRLLRTNNSKLNPAGWNTQTHTLSPYFVLMNVKTGKWTTEKTQPLISSSPHDELNHLMNQFYGQEMAVYSANRSD